MFRISQVNFSDFIFRISFRISEKLFGFLTFHLCDLFYDEDVSLCVIMIFISADIFTTGGYDLRALETIGMADLIITDVDRRRPPRVTNPFIIEIPIQIEPGNIRPGDTMDAWNFDDRKGKGSLRKVM